MAVYVIKSWRASDQPDQQRNFVTIIGRRQGIISWLLALFGIDPTVTIRIGEARIEFSEASLSGSVRRLIPLSSVCSSLYGYNKPWRRAVGIAFTLFWAVAVVSTEINRQPSLDILVVALLCSIALALLYYFLNRTLTLGFVENSGVVSAIQFKRSVVENQDINEHQAGYVCQMTQYLVERRLRSK
jgi:hypothetical protein